MNRIDRLTAILIHLQSKQVVKAEEIAGRFEISIRTVYRDIRALEEAGIPIGAEAGKGYFLTEGYHLPPVMFTQKEAIAMLMAGKLTEKLIDKNTNNDYNSALFKIKSVLSSDEKEFLSKLNERVEIFYSSFPLTESVSVSYLTEIQNALVNQLIISIDYLSYYKNELTQNRLVEPIGLCYYSFTWHLIGFCKLRNEYRDFRLDRIKKMNITSSGFERKKTENIESYFRNLMNANDLIEIVIKFDKSVYSELKSQKYYYGFINERDTGTHIEMTFLNNSLSYIAGWVIKFGKHAEIVRPENLKHEVKNMVSQLCEYYLK